MNDENKIAEAKRIFMAGMMPELRKIENLFRLFTRTDHCKRSKTFEKARIVDCRGGGVIASVSQVNAGIVRKDLARIAKSRAAFKKLTAVQLPDPL